MSEQGFLAAGDQRARRACTSCHVVRALTLTEISVQLGYIPSLGMSGPSCLLPPAAWVPLCSDCDTEQSPCATSVETSYFHKAFLSCLAGFVEHLAGRKKGQCRCSALSHPQWG